MEYHPSYNNSLRADILPSYSDSLMHHGVKGMKWGVRRYQNRDGSYTSAGKKHRKNKSSLIDKYNSLDAKTKKQISMGLAAIGTGIAAKNLYDDYNENGGMPQLPFTKTKNLEPKIDTDFKPIDEYTLGSKRKETGLIPGDKYMTDNDVIDTYYGGDKEKYKKALDIENSYALAKEKALKKIDDEYRKRLDRLDSNSMEYSNVFKEMERKKRMKAADLYINASDALDNL